MSEHPDTRFEHYRSGRLTPPEPPHDAGYRAWLAEQEAKEGRQSKRAAPAAPQQSPEGKE